MAAAMSFQELYGSQHGAASGQHGVEDDGMSLWHVIGKFDKILHWLQSLFIAVKPYDADARGWYHVEHAIHKPKACPQNGNYCHFFAFKLLNFHWPGPALHNSFFQFEIPCGLICEQAGDFIGQSAKFAGGGAVGPEQAQFVPDKRLCDYMKCHFCILSICEM